MGSISNNVFKNCTYNVHNEDFTDKPCIVTDDFMAETNLNMIMLK